MKQAKILVVEDDSIIALELEDRLQVLGYDVADVTASGESAVERSAEMHPDLVLMDIRLRGNMDGVEAAAEIGSRLDIPVVYLTAHADDGTLQRAKMTAPYGYIIKPFDETDLRTAIEMALYKHEMERKLKEHERWLSTTLNSIGDAVIATDDQQLVSFMNPLAEALTGWQQGEALGREVSTVFQLVSHREGAVPAGPVQRALRKGAVAWVYDQVLLSRDGTTTPVDASAALIRGEEEQVLGVVLAFRDISERKREEQARARLQAQLHQAQKMEALGVLTGGIAHDFNNLMTTVIGYSSLLLSKTDEQDPMHRRIESIKRAGEQAASLTQQILAFSRRQTSQPQVLDLNAVIKDLETMFQRLLGENTELTFSLEPGLCYVKVDPAQIERVIMNLVVNAYEAMPGGGKIIISTENVVADGDLYPSRPEQEAGRYVCLSVIDTGVGMDTETRQRIFEPFFSTKEEGTGLGLSVVYGVVRQHGGWIDVVSEPGRGCTFQIYLPAVFENLVYEAAESDLEIELQGAGQRILLVEDEDSVRAAVGDMLRSGGYEVVGVETAEQALYVFERDRGEFDLVFSDVVLPDGDGLQLVEFLISRKPGLPVLLSSGYPDRKSQWPVIREKGYPYLPKPYSLSELLPAVEAALAGGDEESEG
jgi:PAS domain S-box-containing protein